MQERELTRREREIMDILFTLEQATAKEIHARLADAPSYSTVRAMLSRLEEKGVVSHTERELRYVYAPVVARSTAQRSAVKRLVDVFYDGSFAKAVTGLVGASGKKLSDEELDAIEEAIAAARKKKEAKK